MKRATSVLFAALAGACAGGGPAAPVVVSGQVALAGFPAAPVRARVLRGADVVAWSDVVSDGRFSVTIPPGRGYHIELVAAGGSVGLVYPRAGGAIDASFDVGGNVAPFDLGTVRYLGTPGGHKFLYASVGGAGAGAEAADGDNVQCEDGVDPTGAVCVDDQDDEGEACGGGDGEENDGENADVESADDGAGGGGGGDAALPLEAAVADHNLPASLGCADEGGDEGPGQHGDHEGEHAD